MILNKMLQRLFAGLANGPGLNARPQNSRQRLDVMDLLAFKGEAPESIISTLLGPPVGSAEFPAKIPAFRAPDLPADKWTDEQRAAKAAYERQSKLLTKIRDIVEDATDYYNDHGEHALFIGYPLLSIPAGEVGKVKSSRILAPILLSAVNIKVRRDARPGISVDPTGEGVDLVVPNPALMAWLEQQTGENTDDLFDDESGEEPWREIEEVLAFVCKTIGLDPVEFTPETKLQSVPRTDALPSTPTILPAAVLGLFPMSNPGLMRDTKWMIANEPTLVAPVRRFLSPLAVEAGNDVELPAAEEWDHSQQTHRKNFTTERLITHADPCQAEAVSLAQTSEALVIHGPPGTGKSQTIANVIGDHLARNQKVLFVCDKRTALDVVKFRLDSMGVGHLCGVIHDPARDRRDFYMGLRQRLEDLADQVIPAGRAQEHERLGKRLNDLHAELHGYFAKLHGTQNGSGSFHDLTGRWFDLVAAGAGAIKPIAGLTVAMVEAHRADCEEILRRAGRAQWAANPFRGKLAIDLNRYLAIPPQTISEQFAALGVAAEKVDASADESLLALDPSVEPGEQARYRRGLADRLEAVCQRADQGLATAFLQPDKRAMMTEELPALEPELNRLDTALDRELFLQIKGSVPALGETNVRLLAIDEFLPVVGSWKAIFAGGKKKKAAAVVEPLALPLTKDGLQRARDFYSALKARLRIADFANRCCGRAGAELPKDEELKAFVLGAKALQGLFEMEKSAAARSVWGYIESTLGDLAAWGEGMVANLRMSADRAEAIQDFDQALRLPGILSQDAGDALIAGLCENGSAAPAVNGFREYLPVLEDAVRLDNRLREVPPPLQEALDAVLAAGMDWDQAEAELSAAALALEIQERIRSDAELARIDTERVESAFSELVDRTAEKQMLVRGLVVDHWHSKAQSRLLAGTGSRLNSLGASLRQRLFIRGKKAMKLRQMLAAGADTEGGDPIFDLCPVWMASPSTVAQIFSKEPIFDVIVFDEASQCRLEEALPVLLRGKRVVVAGDPKQLPPTRFFEQTLADSEDTSAETIDEVFQQQQSEAEDLLSAALNLDVHEAFLDVHYRSRNEALIGFSNDSFYSSRLQPIPGHPKNRAGKAPIRLVRIDGVYKERGNEAEAKAAADLVAELLDAKEPPSVGIACFNVTQRDLILDALDEKVSADAQFAERLQIARKRRGRDSFEGLFVKNLENVQGDERDHMIICTTFGLSPEGKFLRNFGALSRAGGERRLNVLVTRARDAIHILTSIPRTEYLTKEEMGEGRRPNGRHYLYDYLRYAEGLERIFNDWQDGLERARRDEKPQCEQWTTTTPSKVAEGIGNTLIEKHGIGSTIYWGNDGFCVDAALTHPEMPADVTIGVLADFTRYRKTPDPILWEQFRTFVLRSQGWHLHRVWAPAIFRDPEKVLREVVELHREASAVKPDALEEIPK